LEPEIREYLIRIVNTIGIVILWMIINSTTGIMLGYAFMDGGLTLGNVIFYAWLLLSSAFVIRHLIKLWSKPLNIPK